MAVKFICRTGSYDTFLGDTDAHASSHWQNVRLFAYNGLVAHDPTANPIFRVNENASLGEMVLFGYRVFQLGGDGGNTSAVSTYSYWRGKLRAAKFERPAATDYTFSQFYNLSPSLTRKTGLRWQEESGVLDLEFDTGEGTVHDQGYSVPARRAVFAKFLINILHYLGTPTARRSL